ncbi:uncharacterized protein BXIN_1510 [Babesia sp. Xinjiang]|uniref:uncharacterized protein n=1 Tax=Babesia sp. Xinjiang TaxID=462227 RepID=UPI000A236693|nr:uncharacterized protein BXIN_1510 [Babesia sp. Xinjiang]ORM42246.1 hypothetical protein BXIN_1510 [Babesia sp. Xinjiang]
MCINVLCYLGGSVRVYFALALFSSIALTLELRRYSLIPMRAMAMLESPRRLLFVSSAPASDSVTSNQLFASDRFTFDPSLVKKRRRATQVNRGKKVNKRLESDHSVMHGLAKLGYDQPNKEDLRAASLQEFVMRIERPRERNRLPAPAESHERMYDALLYLKGLPYETTEDDLRSWLSSYDIVYVVLIKNENGCFTGDAYVRCSNISERDRLHREMSGKPLGLRYIPMYRLTESAYLEYYHTGFRREPAKRNHISPNLLVMKRGVDIPATDISVLKTGSRVCGVVTHIYRNGLLLDCGISEHLGGYRERVFCVLMRNRIARNIGIAGQQREWLRHKDLVLFPGIKLNLYVEKLRTTTAQSPFDEDLWREHFGDPFTSLNVSDGRPERSLVYLTMDSSVSDDKVAWWERRLVDSYALFTVNDAETPQRVGDEELFQRVAVQPSWLDGRRKVEASSLYAGSIPVVGNQKLKVGTSRFVLEQDAAEPPPAESPIPYHELVREFLRGSDIDKHGTRYHGFDDPGGYREPGDELPRTKRSSSSVTDSGIGSATALGPSSSDSVTSNRFSVTSSEPQRAEVLVGKGPGSVSADSSSGGSLGVGNVLEDIRRRTISDDLKIFPRTTLYDECIKLPGSGWLLRRSDVPKLAEYQVLSLLRLLGQEPVSSSCNSDYENRMLLCQVIKDKGLGTGLDPRTLITKGLYKVNQSKKKLKRIIELTKSLTGRRFTTSDLESASKSELHMLADESLRKFADWCPSDEVKRTFIDMYGVDFGITSDGTDLSANWDLLKWRIIIHIYGEQSDLKSIIAEIDKNDLMFGEKPGSSSGDLGQLVEDTISDTYGQTSDVDRKSRP